MPFVWGRQGRVRLWVIPAAGRKKNGSRGSGPVSHDAELYKEHNTVERASGRQGISQGCCGSGWPVSR
ncbi:hypothetical protein GCM10018790_57630 [Kitasatospora xanthocidica]|nr:hypothetical protein GCM10018790_57630 [Kitasatospora xanthocidica]